MKIHEGGDNQKGEDAGTREDGSVAARRHGDLAEAYNLLGLGLMSTGKVDAAIPDLERPIQFNPSLSAAITGLGADLVTHQE